MTRKFIQKSSLKIPNFKNLDVAGWIRCRFVETFGDDDIIAQFIKSRGKRWDTELYTSRLAGDDGMGLISYEDYMNWLIQLRGHVPKRFKKQNVEEWIQIIATIYGPYTFEQCKGRKVVKGKLED